MGLLRERSLPVLTLANVCSTVQHTTRDVRVVELPFGSMLHRSDRRISETILKS